jgi:Ca2+-binding RTX toxin-like protein
MSTQLEKIIADLKAAKAVETTATGNWQTIQGSDGLDLMDLGAGHNVAFAAGGNDLVISREGYNQIDLGAGDDAMAVTVGKTMYDAVDGGEGRDTIYAADDNTVIGLRSMAGIETISADGHANVSLRVSDWTTLDLSNVWLTGIQSINGASAGETIIGSRGDDLIIGGEGYDALSGGRGNDTFVMRAGEAAYDRVDGGSGLDTIKAEGDGSVLRLSSLKSVETISSAGFANVTIQASDWATIDLRRTALDGITKIMGASAGETITGSAKDDVIDGGNGYDRLNGFDGDDTFLYSGTDGTFDRVNGGNGNDSIHATSDNTVIGLSSLRNVEVIDGGGYANVSLKVSDWASINLSKVTLSGIDRIEGSDAGERIIGTEGDDKIIGGNGYDTLRGNGGNDTFIVRATDGYYDRVYGGEGKDSIIADGDGTVIGLSVLRDIERIDANGAKDVVIRVSEWARLDLSKTELVGISRIEGASAGETIKGSAGNDTIDGKEGYDTLSGSGGADTFLFRAGSGHDTIRDFNGKSGDVLDLHIDGISSFASLSEHMTQVDKNVMIEIGDDSIQLNNVKLAALKADYFHFS